MENNEIEHYKVTITDGLTSEQVEERKAQHLDNKTNYAVGKSYTEIIFTNVLSFFNILLFVIAGFMIYAGKYDGLFFLVVLIPNIIIGLYEDIKARIILSRLRLLTQPHVLVIRNGCEESISTKELVLDDIMHLKSEAQICTDGVVVQGELLVNESFLTGESQSILKKPGDQVFSGSFVVSGDAYAQATKIGKDSYIETIQKQANKFKRSPSQILRSLKKLFRYIGIVVIFLAGTTLLVYGLQGKFQTTQMIKEEVIAPISGSMVAMIPSGLYLLTSVTLATAVISLSKKHAQVQDFYSIEMLARTNVLCVDKTGTITDGTMSVKKVVPLNGELMSNIEQIVSNVLQATKDDNFTAKGLKEYFTYDLTKGVETALPFNSDTKCSAATFKGDATYAIGAPEFINLVNKPGLIKRAEEYTSMGYRVLVVAKTDKPIKDRLLVGLLEPIALIVMQDHIKPGVKDTLQWFKDNGVEIKVISGDNAITVSEIARQAGVENADHYISLEGMSDEEVEKVAPFYTVFGRVNPKQKEIIVKSLKAEKKTVAMTGDGVNDILALKRADCSIAMASGSDAARNVSHIVLLNSDFDTLPSVVAEGRRVINNLQRTASLFLTKTIFAIFLSAFFLITSLIMRDPSIKYPFTTHNLYIWEIFNIGAAAFFIALERSDESLKGHFLPNVLKRAVPAAATLILPVLCIYIMFWMQRDGVMYTGIMPDLTPGSNEPLNTSEAARTMCTIVFTILSLVILFKVCKPFSKYRRIVFASVVAVDVLLLVIFGILTYTNGWNQYGNVNPIALADLNIFKINFLALSGVNYFECGVIIILAAAIYYTGNYITHVVREKRKQDVKDQSGSTPSN